MLPSGRADDAALERAEAAARRIDEWRSHLLKLSAGSIIDVPEVSFLGRELRAAATIAAMAELEALLRDMLVSIGDHVTSSRHAFRELIPSLRALAAHASFSSLSALADVEKVWSRRLRLTQLENSDEIVEMPQRSVKTPQPPLDGRTIQARHLSLVWQVLGMPNPIPNAASVASLKKLVQIRNDVAHRNVEINEVFSQAGRSAADIAKYLDHISVLVRHIGNEWSTYIGEEAYLIVASRS